MSNHNKNKAEVEKAIVGTLAIAGIGLYALSGAANVEPKAQQVKYDIAQFASQPKAQPTIEKSVVVSNEDAQYSLIEKTANRK